MRDMLREYVGFAAGLAEQAGRRVVGTASELLERAGIDLAAAERAVREQLPPELREQVERQLTALQTRAGELVTVGRGGVDLVVGLARSEAEQTLERVGRLGDQVVKVGVVLGYLEQKLRDLEGEKEAGPAGDGQPAARPAPRSTGRRAQDLFAEDWQPEEDRAAGPEQEEYEDRLADPLAVAEDSAAVAEFLREAAREPGVRAAPGSERVTAGKAPARKSTARKAPARKSTAERAPAKRTAAKAAAGKEPAAKKSAEKKSVTKKAAEKKAAEKKVAAKRTATAAKQGTPRKAAAKRTPTAGGGGDV
ncbi:hypothetical protein ACIGXM_24690 [Kitasatospora sp. NPDC052896]|uniref:hypothetical protein n=1 Tax=Kitasatospora sp. NPDC052896 TaxID=3364061 RepID=UPI0037CA1A38